MRALELLGQIVPEKIDESPPIELLEWACQNIDRQRIPKGEQGLVFDDFPV
ncbi:MAG: hypothetical protein OEU35_05255 [Desulfuromonadales bacterium]|nr:hypothetical protein [Desulfuromonadales bacterium]